MRPGMLTGALLGFWTVLALACGGDDRCNGEALIEAAKRGGGIAASATPGVTDFMCFQDYARAEFDLQGDRACDPTGGAPNVAQ